MTVRGAKLGLTRLVAEREPCRIAVDSPGVTLANLGGFGYVGIQDAADRFSVQRAGSACELPRWQVATDKTVAALPYSWFPSLSPVVVRRMRAGAASVLVVRQHSAAPGAEAFSTSCHSPPAIRASATIR